MDISFPLQDFVELFPPPQFGRIVDGFSPEFDAHKAFDIPRGSILKFNRKVNPNVSVSFRDGWGGEGASADRWINVTLPLEFPGKFELLPFDPVSGDPSPDHIFHSVEDLIEAFPTYVQANSSYGKEIFSDAKFSFDCGDRFKLSRMVYKEGVKYLECRLLDDSRIKLLPTHAVGDFTALPDDTEYTLNDLVNMLPRKRRVKLAHCTHKIPGLPSNYSGDLFIEEPESFIEASLPDGVIIGLPSDIDMNVAPDEVNFERGQLLNTFASNNRSLFPVVTRVVDWDEESSILENHYVRPGVELVVHGWTRQSKVLAFCRDKYYAIPLPYQGKFRIQPKQFLSVADLEVAYPGNKIRCIHADSSDFPLSPGDIFKIKRIESIHKGFRMKEIMFLRCEKIDGNGRTKDVRLPMSSHSHFEEVLEGMQAEEYYIRDLKSFVDDQEVVVNLISGSCDQKIKSRDLPTNVPITLCHFIVEPSVYVSIEQPDAPAFHIPLRTLLYVSFVEQLERSCSPLLLKKNPKLSTLDRCVERISQETFASLRPLPSKQVNGEYIQETNPQHWQATAYYSGYAVRESTLSEAALEDVLPRRTRRVSSSESDIVVSKTKSGSIRDKLKGRFRKHRSQENLFKDRENDFVPMTFPRDGEVNRNPLFDMDNGHEAEAQVHVQSGDVTFGAPNFDMNIERQGSAADSAFTDEAAQSTSMSSTSSPLQSPVSPPSRASAPPSNSFSSQSLPSRSASVQDIRHSPKKPVPSSNLRSAGSLPSVQMTPNHFTIPIQLPGSMTNGTENATMASPQMMLPPGYALIPMAMPTNQQNSHMPPGYALVPMMPQMFNAMQQFNPFMQQNGVSNSNQDDQESSDEESGSNFTLSKGTQFKVVLPPDGNLYHFSSKKMAEFLHQLKLEPAVVKACLKNKVDGKKFSQLQEADMEKLGLIHPVVMHFRKSTFKKKSGGSTTSSLKDFRL